MSSFDLQDADAFVGLLNLEKITIQRLWATTVNALKDLIPFQCRGG